MDERPSLLFIFYSLLFFQSTSSCSTAANIYHIGFYFCTIKGRHQWPAIFAAIHFLFAKSISILDLEGGLAIAGKKSRAPLIRLLQSQGQKNHPQEDFGVMP